MEIIFIEKPSHRAFKDKEGQKFNRLLVIGFAGRKKNSYWWCQCDCGIIIKVETSHLSTGHTQSCGCYQRERVGDTHRIHGLENSPEYNSYRGIIERCRNINFKYYKYYGGRGIKFRFNSFEEFYEEVGEKPEPKSNYSIERINNNGHYEAGNIRWATRTEQQRNRRNNSYITFKNEIKCVSEWAEIFKINSATIYNRINKYNWCINCALTIQPNFGKEICKHKGE